MRACRRFVANALRLQLYALAYNLANFLRTLALPAGVSQWSTTTLRERLVKIGARIVRHGRLVIFQMAEVMVPRVLFQKILDAVAALRPLPPARCRGPRRAGGVGCWQDNCVQTLADWAGSSVIQRSPSYQTDRERHHRTANVANAVGWRVGYLPDGWMSRPSAECRSKRLSADASARRAARLLLRILLARSMVRHPRARSR
jgi:hypothetical protein